MSAGGVAAGSGAAGPRRHVVSLSALLATGPPRSPLWRSPKSPPPPGPAPPPAPAGAGGAAAGPRRQTWFYPTEAGRKRAELNVKTPVKCNNTVKCKDTRISGTAESNACM